MCVQGEPGSTDYGGPYPLSTPEARIIKLAAETASPHAFVALQSGAEATARLLLQHSGSCCAMSLHTMLCCCLLTRLQTAPTSDMALKPRCDQVHGLCTRLSSRGGRSPRGPTPGSCWIS